MMNARFLSWSMIVLAVALAGCLEGDVDADAGGGGTSGSASFPGADRQWSGAEGGSGSKKLTFTVPAGSDELRIMASYAVGGSYALTLKDPVGMTKEKDEGSGGSASGSDTWYRASNPAPGTWTLTMTYSGGLSYSFGVYYTA